MAKVESICISEKRGTVKRPVDRAVFRTQWGIEGDAHAGPWHRQVSLLSSPESDAFRAAGHPGWRGGL